MGRHMVQDDLADRTRGGFSTAEPGPHGKWMPATRSYSTYQEIGTDAVDSWDGNTNTITAAAHAAKKGDLIWFTAGNLDTHSFSVYSTGTNAIVLAESPFTAPVALDAFKIMRSTPLATSSTGGISSEMSFILDGTSTAVNEDTVTPANNVPLPVKLSGVTGDITVTAQQLNVQTSHTGANPDSMQIGDGTETVNVNASNEMQVRDDDANTALSTIAGDTTSLDGKVTACDTGAVTISAALPAGTNNIGDVDIASSVLPTGAATEASLATVAGDTTSIDGKITACNTGAVTISAALPAGTNNIGDVDVLSCALPTGAATEATLATVAGDTTSIDGKITACNTGAVTISAALPAGTNNIGDVDVLSIVAPSGRSSVELIRNDYTSTNVTTGAYVQLVASTSGTVNKLDIFDSSGETLVLATGAAASEVDVLYITPGGNGQIDLAIASGTRLSVKAVSATASVGELTINALG